MAKLEPEQDALLVMIVEMIRSVPRLERSPFIVVESSGGDFLLLPGANEQPQILASDVKMLARYGLVQLSTGSHGSLAFDITPEGFEYYENLKLRAANPVAVIESDVMTYLDGQGFASRHSAAFAKWGQAAEELWRTDSDKAMTSVGHHAREAIQFFATDLVEKYRPPNAPTDPALTVARMRAVVELASVQLGEAERAFLDALIGYWGAVIDLAQRQEHGAAKVEPLTWEDARRLVFQVAVLMFELDRVFVRALGA